MKLIFLLASAYDPHSLKKVEACKAKGYDVVAYGFCRDVDVANNKYPQIRLLGTVQNRHYLKRIKTVYSNINQVIDYYGNDAIYYATTFDIALICYLRKVKYIYGISDIVHSSFPKLIRNTFILIDRHITRGSCATMLTSPAFSKYLKFDDRELKKCRYLLNKLNASFSLKKRPCIMKPSLPFTIGFVGYIRYPNTILKLSEIIGSKYPNYRFEYYGVGEASIMDIVKRQCQSYPNVIYKGPFKNPDDLDEIYSHIDIVACNYDTRTINERLAEPNKLYEALFYNRPIIVTTETYLAERVKQIGCGIITDNSIDDIMYQLSNITSDMLIKKSYAAQQIDISDLIEDFTPLFDVIDKILGTSYR